MAEKIIDPFTNVQNVDPEPMSLDSVTPGGASQNFFGTMTVVGRILVKDSTNLDRILMGEQAGGF